MKNLLLLFMKRVSAILILCYILVNTMSLSLQVVYKNYFCLDTKEYLTIAGRQITVCGQTCDFEVQQDQQDDSGFVFNHSAPPLFYQIAINDPAFLCDYGQNEWHYINHYQFTPIPSKEQPPRG